MKLDKLFYVSTSVVFLLLMAAGFHNFVPHGSGAQGRVIDPHIFPIVLAHGLAIAAWYLLYFLQTLLIAARNRKLHMTLGWSVVVLAPLITLLGIWVAIRSVQVTPAQFVIVGIPYSQFLLLMFAEMVTFAGFVTAGILTRKQPRTHRAMMLCASLTLLSGATFRITAISAIFGEVGFFAIFRPVLALAILLLLVRWVQTRSLDRALVIGTTVLFGVDAIACALATTHAWDVTAAVILGW